MTAFEKASESVQQAIEPVREQLSKGAVLLSAFEVSRDFVPAPNLAEIPHVLSIFIEHSDQEESSRLLVLWTDRDSFTVGVQAFKKRAGLPIDADVDVSWITEIVTPNVPWLKRIKPYAVVLAIAGFLGALEAIHSRYGLFFGSSQAVVRFDEPTTLNVQAGQPVDLKLVVQNNSRVVAARGMIESVTIRDPSTSRRLDLQQELTFGPIKPGDRTDILVPIGKLGSDSSSVEVVTRMEAGLFMPVQEIVLIRPVEVWPALSKARYEIVSQEPQEAWLRGELAVGKSIEGLDCSVELSKAGKVSFGAILMAGVNGWKNPPIPSPPGAEFAQIQWRVPPLEAFSRPKYKLQLITDEPVSWPDMAQRLITRCQP